MSWFTIWNKKDIEHCKDLKKNFNNSENVVEFPAKFRVAPCGCWVCIVRTPFGTIDAAAHKCSKHM